MIKSIQRIIKNTLLCLYSKYIKSLTFSFQNHRYKYFYHLYNNAWENERSVEIPIILEEIKKYEGKNILELGNVLSHYFTINHDVVDKYEKGVGVINRDIVCFHPRKKYDLIVSISTIEHTGWDEKKFAPDKIKLAIANLRKIVAPDGKIILTIPRGYNKYFDDLLDKNQKIFTEKKFLKKISEKNEWIETKREDIYNLKYDYPFGGANGITIVKLYNLSKETKRT